MTRRCRPAPTIVLLTRHAHHRFTMKEPRDSSACVVCSALRVGVVAVSRRSCSSRRLPIRFTSSTSAISTSCQCERLCLHCIQRCSTLCGGLALVSRVIKGVTSYIPLPSLRTIEIRHAPHRRTIDLPHKVRRSPFALYHTLFSSPSAVQDACRGLLRC